MKSGRFARKARFNAAQLLRQRKRLRKRRKRKPKNILGKTRYQVIRSMVKKGCLAEQETKYETNKDPGVPGFIIEKNSVAHTDVTDAMERVGNWWQEITPTIDKLDGNEPADADKRLGDEINLMALTTRLEIQWINVPTSESTNIGGTNATWFGRNFDPALCDMTIYLIEAKKQISMDLDKVHAALYQDRPGSLPSDNKTSADRAFRKMFKVLEKVKVQPKYYKYSSIVSKAPNPAALVYSTSSTMASAGTTSYAFPCSAVYNSDGVPTYQRLEVNGDPQRHEAMSEYVGRVTSMSIRHVFNKRIIFPADADQPRDFRYYLIFQVGDWKYTEIDQPLRAPTIRGWNTYTYKDA